MGDEQGDDAAERRTEERTPIPDYERLEVERLLRVFEDESKSRWPVLHVGCVGCLCVPLGLFSICSLLGSTMGGPIPAFMAIAGIAAIYFATRLSTSRAQKESLLRLAELNDPKSVPALLTALAWPDMGDYEMTLQSALVRLLPRLRASDVGLLTWRHRAILRRNLRSHNTDLVVAILRALEQVGNQDDLPLVGSLARGRTRTARQRTIAAAAQECLPALEARVLAPGHALLRVPSDVDSSLLRPTGGPVDVNPDLLLHPEGEEPNEDRKS